ncbi:MAG TPA: SRPBCC domain-containing protein [Chitinophagaceae bacterium]|nr:SRPBCC domain-containing protein [Chitinophagaceae bacterium]
MKNKNFTATLIVDQTPEEVFNAVRNVRGWWSGYYSEEIKGNTEELNDEFSFHAGGGAHYSRQKLIEVISNKKVVWLVTDSKLDFLKKKDEWTGTKIIFDISTKVNKTQLVFTHDGLMPDIECFNSCAPAWSQYLYNKLLPLITSGKGNTDKK